MRAESSEHEPEPADLSMKSHKGAVVCLSSVAVSSWSASYRSAGLQGMFHCLGCVRGLRCPISIVYLARLMQNAHCSQKYSDTIKTIETLLSRIQLLNEILKKVRSDNDCPQALKKRLATAESSEFQLWKKNKELEAEIHALRLESQFKIESSQ